MDAEAKYWKDKWSEAMVRNESLMDLIKQGMEVMNMKMKGKKKAKKGCK